uniref:Oxidoreductase 3 n=1 Tax=Callicarpa americana TaxID=204211 RepID=A0A9Y1LMZ9_CALAM|nr:oxidoreductase 3 [Callicarpa americana]
MHSYIHIIKTIKSVALTHLDHYLKKKLCIYKQLRSSGLSKQYYYRLEMEKTVKVCVTGAAGYLASFLVKHLLERGYTVHATLRSLGDASKVGLLKGLAHADTRLKLFEADIYNPAKFAPAIEGCEFVVHMATPLQHYDNNPDQFKNTSEAAVAGVKIIMESCMKSNTVKKLIYTASIVATSPLKDDGSGYKDFVDETCWTPLNLSYEIISEYIHSKTLAEKEVLKSYNGKGIEVVSLACGLVGGDTLQSFMSGSTTVLTSQALNDGSRYKVLRVLEELLSKVPIVHIQDVTEAHIFSMENSAINGRFLCASAFLKSAEMASLIQKLHPDIIILPEYIEDTKRETSWGSRKLEDLGFQYKCDAEKIMDDSILCAKRLGNIV